MNAPLPEAVTRYSMAEIVDAIGKARSGVFSRAEKEKWPFEEVAIRGGKKRLYPMSTLPKDVRDALQKRAVAAALPVIAKEIAAPIVMQAPMLSEKHKLERNARKGVRAAIVRLMVDSRCSQESALHTLMTNARMGQLEPGLLNMLRLARDPRGRSGDGFPSIRTLKRWLSAQDLTPKAPKKDLTIPVWAKTFLGFYQQPQKPSVDAAYREFCHVLPADEQPSVHQVRRFLDKLGTVTRERGRMGARELKNIRPFIRREFESLEPNEIWSADGHCFDAEVQHPFHGRPFRPEITSIIDIATRRIVGFSVSLAESAFAVLDALRNAVENAGRLAIFYVDRGSGYDNALIKDEGLGLRGALGFQVVHSLPYNSQARGVIERLHQTVWVAGAKLLPSYIGAVMDREAKLAQFKLTRKALKAGGAMPLMPWDVFMEFCRQRVAEYNARAHRSLKGVSPDLRWREYELKGWQADRLEAAELDELFRPRVARKLLRGEIQLFTNVYACHWAEEFHGETVHVAYDINRPETVWLYTPEGRFMGTATVNGNTRRYMPVPVSQMAMETRAKGREKRVKASLTEIREELNGPALAAPAEGTIVLGGRVIEVADILVEAAQPRIEAPVAAPVARSARPIGQLYDEWQALDVRIRAGDTSVSEDDAYWHQSFTRHPGWRAEARRRAEEATREAAQEGSRGAG